MYTRTHTQAHTGTHMHTRTQVHTQTHKHTHTHTHTHTQPERKHIDTGSAGTEGHSSSVASHSLPGLVEIKRNKQKRWNKNGREQNTHTHTHTHRQKDTHTRLWLNQHFCPPSPQYPSFWGLLFDVK